MQKITMFGIIAVLIIIVVAVGVYMVIHNDSKTIQEVASDFCATAEDGEYTIGLSSGGPEKVNCVEGRVYEGVQR